ncbi:MAG: HlyD family secretion protein, partial [Candidatus Binatia bacterium]
MNRKIAVPVIVVAAIGVGVLLWSRRDSGPPHYTGFVEGEERVLRSEVAGRVLEVKFGEGDDVGADTPIASLDDRDIVARLEAKSRERDVVGADMRTQEERVRLTQETWERGLAARRADVRAAEADMGLAEKNWKREQALVATGASTRQLMDEADARRTESRSRLDQVRETLAQTEAQGRDVEVARAALASLGERQKHLTAQIAELEVTKSKYVIRSPGAATRVQTQYLWPGELAQPGTAILSVLDPRDKYVQIYVPVADAANVRVGQRVEIELDGR